MSSAESHARWAVRGHPTDAELAAAVVALTRSRLLPQPAAEAGHATPAGWSAYWRSGAATIPPVGGPCIGRAGI